MLSLVHPQQLAQALSILVDNNSNEISSRAGSQRPSLPCARGMEKERIFSTEVCVYICIYIFIFIC